MTAGDLIARDFSAWFVPAAHQQTGTGTGQGTQGGTVTTTGLKDKESVHKHLAAIGLDAGSKDYLTQFEKICKENGIAI
jgi:hypothetical protein